MTDLYVDQNNHHGRHQHDVASLQKSIFVCSQVVLPCHGHWASQLGKAGAGWAYLILSGFISVAFSPRWIDTSSVMRPVPRELFAAPHLMKNAWLLLILLITLDLLLDVSASY